MVNTSHWLVNTKEKRSPGGWKITLIDRGQKMTFHGELNNYVITSFAVKDDKLYRSQRMKNNVSTDKTGFHINAEDEFNQCVFKTELTCNKIK